MLTKNYPVFMLLSCHLCLACRKDCTVNIWHFHQHLKRLFSTVSSWPLFPLTQTEVFKHLYHPQYFLSPLWLHYKYELFEGNWESDYSTKYRRKTIRNQTWSWLYVHEVKMTFNKVFYSFILPVLLYSIFLFVSVCWFQFPLSTLTQRWCSYVPVYAQASKPVTSTLNFFPFSSFIPFFCLLL